MDIDCYTRAVTDQEAVDRIATLAAPRAAQLLRLRSVKHIYDPTPGLLNSTVVEDGHTVTLDHWKSASQPYKDIKRFLVEETILQYIIGPGLLPVVTALSKAIMNKSLLVTRKIAPKDCDRGVVGHLDGFGVRIVMTFDEAAGETILSWETLFGVL